MLPDFALVRPSTVAEAVAALDDDHLAVCGGTELLLAMKMGMIVPQALVDISRLPELGHLRVEGDELVIGAGVTHHRAGRDPQVRQRAAMLARVEDAVGNARVRAQGSIGGNLCFAEPKSDVATALIALDAEVVLAGPDGVRRMPVADFVVGPYTTDLDDRELLLEVRVPCDERNRATYLKFQTMERPTVGVAAAIAGDRVRVAVGAVGPSPVYADFGALGDVDVDALLERVEPMADLTGSVEYKQHITGLYIRRALEELG